MHARGGNRRGDGRARSHWRGTCQRPVGSGSQDFDRRGHPASRRGASFWLVDASALSRPVFSRPVFSRAVAVRGAYRYADRHSFSDSLGRANHHADAHVIGDPYRYADAYAVAQAVQAQPQAIAHSIRAPERRAIADQVRRAATGQRGIA